MADRPNVRTKGFTRDKLASFLKSHELIKAFEDLSQDVSQTLPDAIESMNSDADSLVAATVFRQRADLSPPAPVDAAGLILASQIFGS